MYDPRNCAVSLLNARRPGSPIDTLLPEHTPADLAQAYAVQNKLVELLVPKLGQPAGYKVGCTNSAARELLGIDSCFSGRCFEYGIHQSPLVLNSEDFHMVGIEPEIAVRVGDDLLAGESWTAERVAELSVEIMPSIEVVESRFSTWPHMGSLAAIADNGVHRELILGEPETDWSMESVNGAEVTLTAGDQIVQQGNAANVDGGPFGVLAWLANHLNSQGTLLKAGEVVTTGVMTSIYDASRGQNLEADYGPLGASRIQSN